MKNARVLSELMRLLVKPVVSRNVDSHIHGTVRDMTYFTVGYVVNFNVALAVSQLSYKITEEI